MIYKNLIISFFLVQSNRNKSITRTHAITIDSIISYRNLALAVFSLK